MKKLILLLFIPLVSLGQEVNYNPENDILTIDVPENTNELLGYPSVEELDSEAIIFFNSTSLISWRIPSTLLPFW